MTNWKKYTIEKICLDRDYRFARFHLNDHVRYKDGSCKTINLHNCSSFKSYHVGDFIAIDLDSSCLFEGYNSIDDKIGRGWDESTPWVRRINSVEFLEEVNQLSNKVKELERKIFELESSNNSQVSLKRNIEENLIKTQSEKIGLQELMKLGKQALDEKNSQISRLNEQIKQITNEKDENKRELTLSEEEVRKITELFSNLQTVNKEKDQEITKQAKKIKELKESLGKSQEEILSRKIDDKEEKLEIFLQQFRISLEQIRSLLNVYENLINARQNFNHTNIRTAENNIDKIKQEVLNGEISIENKRKICRKCEKLINLKLELEKVYQQQFEAKQEIPTSR